MSSGGGGRGGDRHGGLYHQHGHSHLARADGADYVFSSNDMESFFFDQPAGAGGADEIMPYSGITDYLQGFLEPTGLARHLDVPCSTQDAPVKHELSVDVMSHDSQGTGSAAREGVVLVTPNSSVSFSSSDGEGEGKSRRCKKGRAKAEEEEVVEEDEKDQEDAENSKKP